jgi:hypothetical protein
MSSSTPASLVNELEVAHRQGEPLVLEHGSPYEWAVACHELFLAGRTDVIEGAARHLRAVYPEVQYLATLVAWLDAIPRHLPAPLAFCDDPAAEIQIVPRSGCNSVLLCFCAAGGGTLGLPVSFVHQWLGRLPVSLVYIKDFREMWGTCGYPSLGPDRIQSVAALRRIAAELGGRRIYTFGVSHGGYPALYYGLVLGAAAVLSLGGKTDLRPDLNHSLRAVTPTYLNFLKQVPGNAEDLGESYAAARYRPHVLLAFGADNLPDRTHAEKMMARVPNVELIAVEGSAEHNVIDPLIRRRGFRGLLYRLLCA